MTYCHQSQLKEWLPWVGRHQMDPPKDKLAWAETLRARLRRENREVGIDSNHVFEVFTVTAWGEVPSFERLLRDFPALSDAHSNFAELQARLERWRGAA